MVTTFSGLSAKLYARKSFARRQETLSAYPGANYLSNLEKFRAPVLSIIESTAGVAST